MNNKNVLVTGANGFVGSALLEKLTAEASGNKIIAMHRRTLASETSQRFGASVQWIKADITTDELREAVTDVGTVFHLAAHSSVGESPTERQLMKRINVDGTQRLAAAARQSGVRHFIYVSSIAACETGAQLPIDELNGFPASSYGKSKKAAEDILMQMSGDNFAVTVLRPTALFGENHLGSIYELVKAIRRGRFVLFGNGDNHTNFYYIRDFIDVLAAVKDNAASHGKIFIAGDVPCRLNNLVSHIVKAIGHKRPIPRIPFFAGYALAAGCDIATNLSGKTLPLSRRRFRAMTRDVTYSNSNLLQTLNISPAYGVLKGLDNTIKWYRETGLI